ncbi:MAG TPA: hypothetical protein PKW15_02645 [Alphaproteobacteria bacterium]|nr:hypothetical protein [Rhodospirillaceae bacterium]HRJ12123.1 hypothetical protein [Alphaproteobacteria bacterium]
MDQAALQNLTAEPPVPELSFVVRLDEITNSTDTLVIDANLQECTELAHRFGLPYLRNLSAEVSYRRTRSGQMIRIDGRITANYSQLCSATMLPMPVMMEESFQTEYTLVPWEKVSEFDLDQPEVLSDDFLDMGEIVAQYFGLAIDPYLRRPGTETLAELADSITAAVGELTAQAEAAIAPLKEAAPLPLPQAGNENEPLAVKLAEPTAESPPEIQVEIAEIEVEEPPMAAVPEPEKPQESLFFRYLREMQSL